MPLLFKFVYNKTLNQTLEYVLDEEIDLHYSRNCEPEPTFVVINANHLLVSLKVIGIIRRKALIKELAAAYHAECLTYCQELLELQKKIDEASNFTHLNIS